MTVDGFANYLAEVGGEGEVSALVELRLVQTGPSSVDFSALDWTSQNEHHVGVAVVGAAIAVFADGASEFGHSDDDGVFGKVAEIDPEGSDGLRKLAKNIGNLALRAAFVDVMVPASDIGEGDLHAEVGLDELRKLAQAVAEVAVRIVGSGRGLIFRGVGGAQHFDSVEGLLPGAVKNGIDVLEEHDFRELRIYRGQTVKIGLVTNETGSDSLGRRTIDVLAHASGIQLAAIFSPEHGILGSADSTDIHNSEDSATGVPVVSVYGNTDAKRRPSIESIAGLDAIVVDIQDVGVRFYTYETTLGYFLEAAAKAGKPIIILDRPNPIGGASVYGPVADPDRESFVSYWQTPIQHGMTIGELAKMFNMERAINAKLSIVRMEGWMRGDWFDSTGELWINPSPNMRSLTEAILYPGTGMIETTNVSVGRGTDTPFELVGAPWIVPQDLARYLNDREIGGVRFVPVHFTPAATMYAGEKCGGVNIVLTDRNSLDGPELGLELASALQSLYPDRFKITGLDTLMVNKSSLDAVAAGDDPRRVADDWRDAQERFKTIRSRYLIY